MASTTTSMTSDAPVRRKKRTLAPLIITVLIAAIGFAVIGTSTSGGAGMYNYSLAELEKRGSELAGKPIKVSGRIAANSVRGEPASDSFRFDLEDDEGHKIAVAYKRLLPDPFEEGRDAIVNGKMKDGVLFASNLTVKCPSRYADTEEMQDMSEADRQRYYRSDYKKHAALKKKAASEKAAPEKAAPEKAAAGQAAPERAGDAPAPR